jgi:hypothetical protein
MRSIALSRRRITPLFLPLPSTYSRYKTGAPHPNQRATHITTPVNILALQPLLVRLSPLSYLEVRVRDRQNEALSSLFPVFTLGGEVATQQQVTEGNAFTLSSETMVTRTTTFHRA